MFVSLLKKLLPGRQKSVVAKPGTVDADSGCDMSGWQGRVIERYPASGTVLVQLDSVTLRNLPAEYIVASEETGLFWRLYIFNVDDLEPAEARDTPQDVEEASAELELRYAYYFLGEDGRKIQQILDENRSSDEDTELQIWERHLKQTLHLPFSAVVDEWQERGRLQSGDRVHVVSIGESDPHYGLIATVRKGQRIYSIPLSDLGVRGKRAAVNATPVWLYALWFANRLD